MSSDRKITQTRTLQERGQFHIDMWSDGSVNEQHGADSCRLGVESDPGSEKNYDQQRSKNIRILS